MRKTTVNVRKLNLPGRGSSKPKLDSNDIQIIREKGITEIRDQARMMVRRRLDNHREAPPKGSPIYKAMHACNCYNREILERSHRIRAEGKLSDSNAEAVANLLTRWIAREYNFFLQEQDTQRSLEAFR